MNVYVANEKVLPRQRHFMSEKSLASILATTNEH